jgi:feruloyl esterase
MKPNISFFLALAVFVGGVACSKAVEREVPSRAEACSALAQMKIANAKEIVAERVTSGTFQTPAGKAMTNLPPFCRVTVLSAPAADSNIRIELWLPETGWNGRLLGTGNGGSAGAISYGGLGVGIGRHFATVNTDMGTSPDGDGVVEHPDRWVDFGYRATHEMTVVAKALVAAYYGGPAGHAYFVGCSTGGQQALAEAQRYPEDYNGIIAGAPANNRTHLHSEFLWNFQALHEAGEKSQLAKDHVELLHSAVLKACVGKDGGAPGDKFLTDPRACRFDPETLPRCAAADAKDAAAGCFTAEQIAAVKKTYAGATNPKTGERIYEALPLGTPDLGPGGGQFYPFHWAFGMKWNPMTFDFDKDEDAFDSKLGGMLNANDPDLSAFQRRGGKLIMYSGTADAIVPFPDAMDYYERVVSFNQAHLAPDKDALAATQKFFSYYLVPGMAHCGGGPGVVNFGQWFSDKENDLLFALELWTELGKAVGAREGLNSGSHRPVCAYPALPNYTGGDPAQPASFRCVDHPRGGISAPAERYLH